MPRKMTKAEADLWINENNFSNKYEICEWAEKASLKSKFLDKVRNHVFECEFAIFKRNLKRNPDTTFDISKEDQIEKSKQTHTQKYGSEHYSKTEEFKNRVKSTSLKKFGTSNIMKSTEGKDRQKESLMLSYGVVSPLKSKDIKKKQIDTIIERYGPDYVRKFIETKANNGSVIIHKGKTITEWAEGLGVSYSHLLSYVKQFGWDEAENLIPSKTIIEQKMDLMIKGLIGPSAFSNKKLDKTNYKPDFVLVDQKIIVEADGLYWHSDLNPNMQNSKYHKEKRKTYLELGFRPFFFRSDEVLKKEGIVKSILMNALGLNSKIGARKCRTLMTSDGAEFLKKNHLMGSGSGRCYCLLFNDEIVSCMQVKKKNDDTVEISRFCTKNGISVIGGFSKLLKFAIKCEEPQTIITFIDQRYGDGSYLANFGFEKKTEFLSFSWTNGDKSFHRMKFPGNSGYDAGLAKIWDCGQAKWELKV